MSVVLSTNMAFPFTSKLLGLVFLYTFPKYTELERPTTCGHTKEYKITHNSNNVIMNSIAGEIL